VRKTVDILRRLAYNYPCADLHVYLQGTLKILLKRLACFSNIEPAVALPLLTVRDSQSRLFLLLVP
jgi:hypothetical protein